MFSSSRSSLFLRRPRTPLARPPRAAPAGGERRPLPHLVSRIGAFWCGIGRVGRGVGATSLVKRVGTCVLTPVVGRNGQNVASKPPNTGRIVRKRVAFRKLGGVTCPLTPSLPLNPSVSDDGSITFVFGDEAPAAAAATPVVEEEVPAEPPVAERAAAALEADRAAIAADAPVTAPGIEAAAVAEEPPLGAAVTRYSASALKSMKVAELRELAAAADVKGASKLKKADLIDALLAAAE